MLNYPKTDVDDATTYLKQYSKKPFRRNSIHPYEWIYLHNSCMTEQPKKILEIGVYCYTSSFAFLKYLETNKDAILYSVDPLHRMATLWHKDPQVNSRWFRVISRSQDFLPHLNEKFDFIFIDGDHSNEGVKEDFRNCMKIISDNGTIVLHDTGSRKLKNAILELEKEERFIWHTGYSKVPSHGIAIWRKTTI